MVPESDTPQPTPEASPAATPAEDASAVTLTPKQAKAQLESAYARIYVICEYMEPDHPKAAEMMGGKFELERQILAGRFNSRRIEMLKAKFRKQVSRAAARPSRTTKHAMIREQQQDEYRERRNKDRRDRARAKRKGAKRRLR